MGWPSRKRLQAKSFTDAEGRVIRARAPVLDQEGLITPTRASYIVHHFDVPPVVPLDNWMLTIAGQVRQPLTLTFRDLQALPGGKMGRSGP